MFSLSVIRTLSVRLFVGALVSLGTCKNPPTRQQSLFFCSSLVTQTSNCQTSRPLPYSFIISSSKHSTLCGYHLCTYVAARVAVDRILSHCLAS